MVQCNMHKVKIASRLKFGFLIFWENLSYLTKNIRDYLVPTFGSEFLATDVEFLATLGSKNIRDYLPTFGSEFEFLAIMLH